MHYKYLFIFFVTFLLFSCDGHKKNPVKIVAFGDSLVAGYRIKRNDSFPAQLQNALRSKGYINVKVLNRGINGQTTTGGKKHLKKILRLKPDIVILELGANDIAHKINPEKTFDNLDYIASRLKDKKIKVLFIGMVVPGNTVFSKKYNIVFETIARDHKLPFYPFFLKDIFGKPKFFIGDNIHPNKKGIKIMVKNVLPYVVDLVEEVTRSAD